MVRAVRPVVDPIQRLQTSVLESPQLVTILLSCANDENLVQGRHAHAYIVSHGFHLDFRVGNALIHMYGSCGCPEDSQRVFDTMECRNKISWNNILAAYAHSGSSKRALDIFEQMLDKKFDPNRISVLMVIFACAADASLSEGKRIHNHILGTAYEHDMVIRTALVNMYGKCGSINDAWQTFEGSLEQDVVAWNAIMSVYAQHDMSREALCVFVQMQQQGQMPSRVSLVNALSACANHTARSCGKSLHVSIVANSLQQELVVGNALINMYGKCSDLKEAAQTFEDMYNRDVFSWNGLVSAYARNENIIIAHQLYSQMHQEGVLPNKVAFVIILDGCSDPGVLLIGKRLHALLTFCICNSNVIVKNALVNMYGMCGKLEDALRVFDEICQHNTISFLTIISACIYQEAVIEGTLIHAYIIECGIKVDVMLGNSLINLYSKCGRLPDTQKVFDTMLEKNVISWTTMVAAFSQHGHGRDAVTLFENMQGGTVKPNKVTFIALLTACSHAGLVEEGQAYFRSMSQKYGIEPTLDHYHCMMDLLARSGRLSEAEKMLNSMPFDATSTSWMILMSACKKEADIPLAEQATRRIVDLDPDTTAPYVMLSNVYLSAGREDLVSLIQEVNCRQDASICIEDHSQTKLQYG